MKSRDLNIELLTISTDNIWKLCGLELKDILIQQECIFIGKDRNNISEGKRTFTLRNLTLNIDRPVVNLLIRYFNCTLLSSFCYLLKYRSLIKCWLYLSVTRIF